MENVVINQHYIPSSLLELFTNDSGKLFEVLLCEKKIYPTRPEDSMSQRFVYEDEMLKTNTIEDYFAKIEDEVAPKAKDILRLIESCKNRNSGFQLIKQHIEELLPIFLIFYYRSGALLTEFSSIEAKDKIPLLSNKILNHAYLNDLARTICNGYKFAIIESNGEFLMSDQYLATAALRIKSRFGDISNRHIGLRDTLIMIPISSSYYAIYWHASDDFFAEENVINNLDSQEVKLINRSVINNSYVKCVGSNTESLQNVLEEYEMKYPSQTYFGYTSGFTHGAILKKEVFFYEVDTKAHWLFTSFSYQDYQGLGVNAKCLCGSNKKYKKCHKKAIERIEEPIYNLMHREHRRGDIFKIPAASIVELPIDDWGGYSEKVKESMRKRT